MNDAQRVQIRSAGSAANAERLFHVMAKGDMTCDAQVSHLLRRSRSCLTRANRLIVDVRGVERADTKLIAAIISLYSHCRRAGVELELHVSRCVELWLSVYQLDWLSSDGESD